MTLEAIIIAIFGVLILGIFLGPNSIMVTFDEATPRLAARVERNVVTGFRFINPVDGARTPGWEASNISN
ncbi:MAG: hypothetical protein H6625_04965 [Bdellovibrionaceae bacterium]|nr:hypothetical protein [Pseudobdellovibrionaceae bacterium]